mmetsp:Transcript_10142/g.26936  ORF Transcript_10142/g.26936 Transcript_10142/m.26936 type:complete len:129 (+) Transcript_10142:254-640(+)
MMWEMKALVLALGADYYRRIAESSGTNVKPKEESKSGEYHTECAEEYRFEVEGKLQNSCGIPLGRLSDYLLAKAATGDLKAIHQSWMADCDPYIEAFGKGRAGHMVQRMATEGRAGHAVQVYWSTYTC